MGNYVSAAKEIIDRLALDVMMLEPQDVEGLGVVLNHLDEVIGVFNEAGKDDFSRLAGAIKSVAEELVFGEHSEPEKGVTHIGDGVSLLQEILTDPDNVRAAAEKITGYVSDCGLSDAASGQDEVGEPTDETVDKESETPQEVVYDKELMESFIMEALEHLGTIEVNVLTLEQEPENHEVIDAIFRPFHTIKGVSGFLNLSDINRLAHEVETLLDDARHDNLAVDEAVTDLVLDAVDLMKTLIDHLNQEVQSGTVQPTDFGLDSFLDRLREVQAGEAEKDTEVKAKDVPAGDGTDTGSILVEKGVVSPEDVAEALEKQAGPPPLDKKIGEILIEEKKAGAKDVAGALREQKKARGSAVSGKVSEAAFVKVDTQKLDNMVDMVGELVITESMIGEDLSEMVAHNKKLYSNLSQLRRITSEIQRISMSLRMIPIKQTFQKMIRLVRDLSKKSGKLAQLKMVGEETEIDRNMVDEIYDPMVHMVRNSMDHGIEEPEVRKAMGKPETGTVTLSAYHKGGNIVIEVSEDGRGLNREKIINKAVERNLISSGDNLSDQEVFGLIFQPGFSTAEQVTDVSGRGVGMDVVKRATDKMRGKLEVQSTEGQGTTILMKLPLTMAIIDGIMVRAGDRNFIIPTASVLESIGPDRASCNTVANQGEMIKIRETLHPLIRLHELFGFEPQHHNPWEAIVVVVESDGKQKCVLVDELLGKHEVVIKSLGEQLKNVKGMAGGAILADGRVGLILDVAGLFEADENA